MDDVTIPRFIYLPCGARARFEEDGLAYRCENCFSVVGSISQPKECKEKTEKYELLRLLGSKVTWNYNTGEEDA